MMLPKVFPVIQATWFRTELVSSRCPTLTAHSWAFDYLHKNRYVFHGSYNFFPPAGNGKDRIFVCHLSQRIPLGKYGGNPL